MILGGTTIFRPKDFDFERVAQAVLALSEDRFYRIATIFEHKWAVKDTSHEDLPIEIEDALKWLETVAFSVCYTNTDVPSLVQDYSRRYAGVFKYETRDHLGPHVDAGIHPETRQRKHWTAIMYLGWGEGDLEFWDGEDCTRDVERPLSMDDNPIGTVSPQSPKVIIFENNDHAWHSAAVNWGSDPRLVLTVSYMSDEVDAFQNKRQRAFFVPRPTEAWAPEVFADRDRRAKIEGIIPGASVGMMT